MASLDEKTADQISKRPRYIETVGEACPLSVTRITREPVEGEPAARDYEFSRKSIDQHIAQGYALAAKTLTAGSSFSMRQPVGYSIGSHRGFRTTKTPK